MIRVACFLLNVDKFLVKSNLCVLRKLIGEVNWVGKKDHFAVLHVDVMGGVDVVVVLLLDDDDDDYDYDYVEDDVIAAVDVDIVADGFDDAHSVVNILCCIHPNLEQQMTSNYFDQTYSS